MKRRQIPALAALALAVSLLFATVAHAAPTLSLEMKRLTRLGTPLTSIARNDEFLRYQLTLKNTSAEETSGPISVSVALPVGLKLAAASGTGWSCITATSTCTTTKALKAGESAPTLDLSQIWIDPSAPDVVTVKATATGGGATEAASAEDSFAIGPPNPFGFSFSSTKAEDEAGLDHIQAGGHPFTAIGTFRLQLRTRPDGAHIPVEDLHTGVGEVPAGFVGSPSAAEALCSYVKLRVAECPEAAAVGGVLLDFSSDEEPGDPSVHVPVFRMVQEKGFPASFGFVTPITSFIIRTKVRSDGDYGITAIFPLAPSRPPLYESIFTFCGYGARVEGGFGYKGCKKLTDPGHNPKAFITQGTNCSAGQPLTRFAIDSWPNQGSYLPDGLLPDLSDPNWVQSTSGVPPLTGCEQLVDEWTSNHKPSFSLQPDNGAADSPAAFTAHLEVPQDGLEDPKGLATSHMKKITVTLPEGVGFNPGIGDGLEACSEEQIGFMGGNFPRPSHLRFDTALPHCPSNSKIGLGTVKSPLLDETLHGSVYLAAQKANPFGSDYAIYLAIEEPEVGINIKLAGKVTPDPNTGQVTTVFDENPQLPFEDLELKFFGGPRSALANPPLCGTYETKSELTPWSAEDPYAPKADEIARLTDPMQITSGPHGSPCVSDPARLPFNIGLSAGSKDPIAGIKSPFSMRITRPDGSQEIDHLELSPPPGFVASLKGIPYCSEAQIAAAKANSGKAEQSSPSCPAASQVGTTNAGAGSGDGPFYAPGKLYLAGPYKGQTLSVLAVTPAVAGPFDLGNVVIRSALKLDPRTARITAVTDPLPRFVRGIPLRIRDVRINLDRPNWAMTPTNCEALSVDMTAYGSNGAVSKPSSRYQVGDCDRLGFKPKLEIHLKGGTKRGDHPALLAILATRPGDANIARAAVTLPPSAFLDQSHIRTICTRVQFAADSCPKGAIYGHGKAVTELLNDPIEGDVFLRSSDNKLPDLVAALKGVANIEAVGRIDSVHGGIRNTFEVIPDAPFDTFTLRMQGGNKGLVVNSQNLCAKDHRATVKLTAQNGRRFNYRPVVIADGCKGARKGKSQRAKRQHRRHGAGGHS